MSDLLHANLTTVQSGLQPTPVTIAAAATIAPSTFVTIVTGTTAVGTITPPVTGQHMLALIFSHTSPGTFVTTGNIGYGTTTPTQNIPVLMFYDPNSAKYYAK
jgi:hypothetical protein